jgi:hypothetical protein
MSDEQKARIYQRGFTHDGRASLDDFFNLEFVRACFAFDRLFAISEPRNAPANPATCETIGFRAILSAANDTAQKPIRPAPAIFVIFESFIP